MPQSVKSDGPNCVNSVLTNWLSIPMSAADTPAASSDSESSESSLAEPGSDSELSSFFGVRVGFVATLLYCFASKMQTSS